MPPATGHCFQAEAAFGVPPGAVSAFQSRTLVNSFLVIQEKGPEQPTFGPAMRRNAPFVVVSRKNEGETRGSLRPLGSATPSKIFFTWPQFDLHSACFDGKCAWRQGMRACDSAFLANSSSPPDRWGVAKTIGF
jgi:hypothetical protein